MKQKDTLSRIMTMEATFDSVSETVRQVREVLDRHENLLEDITRLKEYYASDQWVEDFDADQAGQLPSDLKRGVLSEDGLYDLLSQTDILEELLR